MSPAISSSYQDELHLRHSRTRDTVLRWKRIGPKRTGSGIKRTHDYKLGTLWSEKIWLGKSEVSDEHSTPEVAVTRVSRHRTERRQPPAARWRLDLLDELRRTAWDLKRGSRRSAPGLPHTSLASLGQEPSQRQQVAQVVLLQPSAGTASEDSPKRTIDHTDSDTM